MDKPTLSSYVRDNLGQLDKKKEPGPFITISRQYGCDGYQLADTVCEKLNQSNKTTWRVYNKEILKQLANEEGLAEEIIARERIAKPSLVKDFLRGIRGTNIPDGYEIRNKITVIVRTIAFEGHAIIVGQGCTAATADIGNGLSIRIEAPMEWRIIRVSRRENLKRNDAIKRIEDIEKKRRHLRTIYEQKNPRKPTFNIVFDNSAFSCEQIAEQIVIAVQFKGLITA